MEAKVKAEREEVESLVNRARSAQKKIENYTQQQVDELVTAICWAIVRQDRAEELARIAVDEGGFGNYDDKVMKIRNRCMGTLADMQSVKTAGIIEEDTEKGLIKIAKPVGVVAALIPTTGPDATPPLKTLLAVKGRNAIIVAAHPRTQQTTELTVKYMREACEQAGAPADLVQAIRKAVAGKDAGPDGNGGSRGCHGRRRYGEGGLQFRHPGLWRRRWQQCACH